jgi:hypothetical protein
MNHGFAVVFGCFRSAFASDARYGPLRWHIRADIAGLELDKLQVFTEVTKKETFSGGLTLFEDWTPLARQVLSINTSLCIVVCLCRYLGMRSAPEQSGGSGALLCSSGPSAVLCASSERACRFWAGVDGPTAGPIFSGPRARTIFGRLFLVRSR